jgi:hypothetical protein
MTTKKNLTIGTIINGRYSPTGSIFIGEIIKLPDKKNGKVVFKYLNDFGWSKKNKRNCIARLWYSNIWEVNSKEPPLKNMKFRNQKRPKKMIVTETTTIIKKRKIVKLYA